MPTPRSAIPPTRLELGEQESHQMHQLYRTLHANPELSMQEHKTADLIAGRLTELGLENFRCGGTGVVGILSNGDGPVVAFRADTDGLPIREETGLPYASTATVMHGRGHDTHITAALTAAALLAGAKDAWAGTVVFIFQPGEETAAGARAMVEDGLWEKAPKPEIVFGQHVMPGASGTVSVCSGHAMAMADSWKVVVRGVQAHGSQPQDSVDPIVLGAHMVVRLQTLVSRETHPLDSAVVTVGTFHAGLKENIIPASAEFTVNVRTFTPDVREKVLAGIRRIILAEAAATAAPAPEITELSAFPRCYNDPAETALLIRRFREALGSDSVTELPPTMGSEDFGTLADAIAVPSVYWRFGGCPAEQLADGGPVFGNHSPRFAPAIEPTLSTGVRAALAAILSKVGTAED